jgi:anti-sigma regulatory factor (Ser/Thr protein kinase)
MTNDHHGNLWIATNAGLIRYDETKNQYKEFTRKDGLPSNFVKSIIIDGSGNVWTGFEGALAEINVSAHAITTYNTTDGLPGADLENPLYDPASETMFFCTDRSVVYFNPQQVEKVIPVLSPVVTSFQVMGKEQAFVANKKLNIPYSDNYLSFSFSAPNFINASETEYACKLDGADKDWNYLGNHHFASYSQLQPGNYTFRVMARAKGGKWQQATTPLMISIETPFWRTAWFRIGSAVLFLLVVFSFVYLGLRNKFEKQILAQSIRDKIAGDLHDDIGSTLMSISILSELAKQNSSQAAPYLENISKNALLMQENMSDIVWAINPKNDRFVNIIQHMSQFAAEVLEQKNIEVKFNSDESLSSLLLPMDIRRNFYLFFKEAINNCAKHSMAAQVNILVSCNGQHINLNITDNGKGFDTSVNHKGNGMSTMKRRAEELGGHVKIVSAPGKGTAIFLDFTI